MKVYLMLDGNKKILGIYTQKSNKYLVEFVADKTTIDNIKLSYDSFVDGELIKDTAELEKDQLKADIHSRISILKTNLANTDYLAIKFGEGELSEEEYAETRTNRRAWRAEIADLEARIEALK